MPYYNSLLHTTCVATMLSGGHAPNALPQTARANVNCRIFPGEDPEEVHKTLERVANALALTTTSVEGATHASHGLAREGQPRNMSGRRPRNGFDAEAFVGDGVFDAPDEGADGAAVFQDQVVEAEGLGLVLGHLVSVGRQSEAAKVD